MGALDGGDDALQTGKGEESIESIDGVLAPDHVVGHAAQIVKECVLRSGGGIIRPAGHGIDRRRAAVFMLEHDAVEAVHDTLAAIAQTGGMIAQCRTAPQRLDAVDIHRIVQEPGKHVHGIGPAAHAGNHSVGQLAGHLQKLRAGLDACHTLKVTHHHGERMRAHHRTDAVNGILIFLAVGCKGRVNRLLEGLKPVGHLDYTRTQNLHAGHVGSLFFYIHGAHVDVAFQSEVCRCRCQRHAVLSRAGFGDNLFLAHVLGQERFAHAVIQLVRTGVVEILPLGIQLHVAQRG